MPDPPEKPRPGPTRRGSWTTIATAFSGMLIVTLFLVMLPGMIGIAVAIGMWMLLSLFAFHYLVWGWWLNKMVKSEGTSEDSLES